MRGGEHVGSLAVFVGGVWFAAGCDLWGRRWRFAERLGRSASCPAALGPVGLTAAAAWRKRLASWRAAGKAGAARGVGFMVEGRAGADVVGGFLEGTSQYRIAGQTEDEIDAVFFAPCHHLWAAVMAVAANGQMGVRPVFADAADEAA